jgi:hypothetical protein
MNIEDRSHTQDQKTALAIYEKMEVSDPKESWGAYVDPEDFLEGHNLVEKEQFGKRLAFWKTWFGGLFMAVLIAVAVAAVPKSNLWGFLVSIFQPPPQQGVTVMEEKPGPLAGAHIPKGLKARIEQMNENIKEEKWEQVLEGAMDLQENHLDDMNKSPEARQWLYECLVASRVLRKQSSRSSYQAALHDAEAYRSEKNAPPSFVIDYNSILARFYAQGGESLAAGDEEADWEILEAINRIRDVFGKEITSRQSRVEQLRKIQAYTIIRILKHKPDLEELNKFNYPKTWSQLDDILREWRGKFPEGDSEEQVEAQWRAKPRDLLLCEQWYWRRIAKLEPLWGNTIEIGDREYNCDDAEWNADRINNALKGK